MTDGEREVAGLVLAAGAGTRFGGPKGLARDETGVPWIVSACVTLRLAGVGRIGVVVGARGEEVGALVPEGAAVVCAPDWEAGVSASLRAGLAWAADLPAAVHALVVTLADLVGIPPAVVTAVMHDGVDSHVLRRAVYEGEPGHPVLLGRDSWALIAAAVTGDKGAGPYLARAGAERVEVAHLWHGRDVDLQAARGEGDVAPGVNEPDALTDSDGPLLP
ncbi:nucleotidyltransferase family protein [Miniimonas arenae]|uniref:nucleotidyltransferase family protein n=1 Tax=Miniimonas arenae TaxID=676201 RepID=UPI0028A75253|nr:NTP transferase domain-containing protein [Miniimonas arenae]